MREIEGVEIKDRFVGFTDIVLFFESSITAWATLDSVNHITTPSMTAELKYDFKDLEKREKLMEI